MNLCDIKKQKREEEKYEPLDNEERSFNVLAALRSNRGRERWWELIGNGDGMNEKKMIYREKANPLAEVDVELVEGDMRSGDENFLDKRVDSLKNSEIEKLGAMLV